MTSLTSAAQDVKRTAELAAVKMKPAVAKMIRLGYAAKGVLYSVVGVLALMAALTPASGETTGSRGAMGTVLSQPFGRVMLLAIAVGLASYALWQFFRAAFDPEHGGKTDRKGWGRRAIYVLSGVIHAGLVVAAFHLLTGGGSGQDDNAQARDWTATLMGYPFGRWLVAMAGAGIAVYGVQQVVRGYKTDLDDQLKLGSLSATAHRVTVFISRLGLAARGVIFVVIGGILVIAAWRENPAEAKGLGGALDTLQRQPYGPWLLAAIATGLIAYGIYLFIRARFRRIELT